MTLPLARYRYRFRMADTLRLPPYAGGLLRGQFGAALRHASCMTGASTCDGCMLRATCPYPAIFEAPAPGQHELQNFSHVPNPYVLEAPPVGSEDVPRGQTLNFNMVLFGRALDHLPLVSLALQRALEQGLGPAEARASGKLESMEVQLCNKTDDADWLQVWRAGDAAIAPHRHVLPELPGSTAPAVSEVRLRFHTPLRLQHDGRIVRAQTLTPRKFVADLLRRASLLGEFHAGKPDLVPDARELVRQAETLQHESALRWFELKRFSARQQQEVRMDGLLGEWILRGDLQALLPWLQLGQWLHVGKSAAMGLGGYRLQSTRSANA